MENDSEFLGNFDLNCILNCDLESNFRNIQSPITKPSIMANMFSISNDSIPYFIINQKYLSYQYQQNGQRNQIFQYYYPQPHQPYQPYQPYQPCITYPGQQESNAPIISRTSMFFNEPQRQQHPEEFSYYSKSPFILNATQEEELYLLETMDDNSIENESINENDEITAENTHKHQCDNCKTDKSNMWKFSQLKNVELCNACFLYEKRKGIARPLSLLSKKQQKNKKRRDNKFKDSRTG